MSTSRNPFIQKTVKLLASSITDEFKIPVKYTQAKRIFDSLNVEVTRTRNPEQDQSLNEVETAPSIDEIVEINKSVFSFSAPALEDRYSSLIPLGIFEDGKQFVWNTREHNALIIEAASTSTDHMLLEKTITQHCEILNEKWDLNRISDTVIYDKNATTADEVEGLLKQVETYLNSLLDHPPTGGKRTLNVIDDRFVSFEKISRNSHPYSEQMNKNNELLKKVMKTVSDRKNSMVTLFVATSANTIVPVNPLDEWVKVNTGISFNGSEGFALDNHERVFRIYPSLSKEYVNNLSETSGNRVGKPYFGVIQKPDVSAPKKKVSSLTAFPIRDLGVNSDEVVNLETGCRMLIKGSDIDEKKGVAKSVVDRVMDEQPHAKIIVVGDAVFSQSFSWDDSGPFQNSTKTTVNVVGKDDVVKVERLHTELSKDSLAHPMIVVFNVSSKMERGDVQGLNVLLPLRKAFMDSKQPKAMITLFVEDPEAGADQWLPLAEEETMVEVLSNKKKPEVVVPPKVCVIGSDDMSHALKSIKPKWDFQESVGSVKEFWDKLNNDQLTNDLSVVLFSSHLFDTVDDKVVFGQLVAYCAGYAMVGIIVNDSNPELRDSIVSAVDVENMKVHGVKGARSVFYFIDERASLESIDEAVAKHKVAGLPGSENL